MRFVDWARETCMNWQNLLLGRITNITLVFSPPNLSMKKYILFIKKNLIMLIIP